jgi:hypothetical protein
MRSFDRVRAVRAAYGAPVVPEQLEVVDGDNAELMPHLLAALRLEGNVKPAVAGEYVPRRVSAASLLLELDVRQRLAPARRPQA